MNCAEFEQHLPDMLGSVRTTEQETHLRSCVACTELVSDLEAISQEARLLQGCEEPSPRVWNSIEIVLRQEGLIHEPQLQSRLPGTRSGWSWNLTWLMPAAVALLFAVGIVRYRQASLSAPAQATQQALSASAPGAPLLTAAVTPRHMVDMPADDLQLLEAVGARSPALRAVYANDLQNINQYIRDAEESAQDNPNDEAAQRYLVNAYEQKTMVYEMALDRSLP